MPEIVSECFFKGPAAGVMGGTSDSRNSFGHLKLTYVAQKLFGIHRFATHPERFNSINDKRVAYAFEKVATALEQTKSETWDALIGEVKRIYDQQQVLLAKEFPDGYVCLQRRIRLNELDRVYFGNTQDDDESLSLASAMDRYSSLLTLMVLKAQEDKEDQSYKLETDILTGWCRSDPLNYGHILLKRYTPIADVLVAQPYLADPKHVGLESDEWLVLNRSPSGLMELDASLALIPQEVKDVFLEQARRRNWNDLRDLALQGLEDRRFRMCLPTPAAPWEPVWYVRAAMRLARWLARFGQQ